ncbi:DNA-directed RNA polymerase III subunit RPC3-like [Chenopodium quinoa]|uniref:DNA-directed RNA polymerase III subunit RPC3-like n=1 Tax=Chenopodium quinoa TaxID=63459 RepID=UPI000B789548|nr:DNA-directed RNA polymerase III subunit RPC3-like [Chenopodium quinoa]
MAALTPFGIKLAVHIITTDFGNLVSKICECLLRRGTLSKALISRFTELPQDKVKKCLWVLIQHNCVQAFALEQEGGGKDTTVVVTQYMALFNNIIHRLRFPKFMSIVSKEQDTKGSDILEGLLQHGRLTLTQILDRALASSSEGSSDTHQESFTKLVRCRFVERCPAPEPLISLPNEGDTPAKKGGGRNKVFMKEVTLEERALAAAIPMDAERFSISYDQGVDSDEEKIESKISGLKVGEKRKQDSLDWDSELDTMGGKKEPVWRVNFDEFINCLKIKACVEHVRAEYDNVAAVILKSMLEGAKHTVSSVSLSLDSIFEEVIKSKEGLTMEHLRYSLEQLDFCSETNDVYTINMKDIIKKAQLEEVECIVKKRYGIEAFRIFRSLTNGRPLDTDKISERTFVDKKNTPQTLYKLWKDNYILMEKVTTGGPRQADFFLWSVKKGNLWHQILDELYHAALNLCLRYAYEVDQEREIQNLSIENPSPEVKERRMRLRNVRILLDSSLMKLDDAVMIFHDFLL